MAENYGARYRQIMANAAEEMIYGSGLLEKFPTSIR
jgi:hypothetical protein